MSGTSGNNGKEKISTEIGLTDGLRESPIWKQWDCTRFY